MTGWPHQASLLLTLGFAATMMFAADRVAAEDSDVAGKEPAAAAQTRPRVSADQLLLDRTSIRGNQELPRVLYIVPWKDSQLGNVVGKPVNSLIDEVLAPVDRDVFLRQTKYFDQLYGSEGSGNEK